LRSTGARSVTTAALNDVIHTWLNDGLASETVRKRCTSLQSFFEVQCPTLKNPFHKSDKPKLPKVLEARGVDYVLIERVLATMAEISRCKRNAAALGKIVYRIMAYTGIPPATLNKLAEDDVVLMGVSPSVRVPPREKGEGVEARTLPLSADALNAFRDFDRANGYGCVSVKSASASWRRACRRVGGAARRVRFYDLRHSYLTETYRITRDLATVGRLGLHAEGSPMTSRYARAANNEVDTAAVNAFTASLNARRQAALKDARAPELAAQKLHAEVA
jgi:integrase